MIQFMESKTGLFCLSIYVLSLCLPAIGFYDTLSNKIQCYWGAHVLVAGSLFGWFGILVKNFGILAVYANLFFLPIFIANTISNHLSIFHLIACVMMLLLASLSYFYRDFAGRELAFIFHLGGYIYYWGIGAFFWFMSMIILTLDCFWVYFRQQHLPIGTAITITMISLMIIVAFQVSQYYKANKQEKSHFSKKILLTTYPILGDVVKKPTQDKVAIGKNSVVELIVSDEVRLNIHQDRTTINQSKSPYMQQFQYLGYFWQLYPLTYDKVQGRMFVAKLSPARPVDFYLQIERFIKRDKGYKFTILDKNQYQLWQEKNVLLKLRHDNDPLVYHDYENDLVELFKPLDMPIQIPKQEILMNQHFVKNGYDCQLKKYEGNAALYQKYNYHQDFRYLFYLDNTLYYLNSNYSIFDKYEKWCSPDYAILVPKSLDGLMYLFDRKNKQPMYIFHGTSQTKNLLVESLQIKWGKLSERNTQALPYVHVKTKVSDIYFEIWEK